MASKSRPYEQFGSFILFKRLETDALGDLWRAGRLDNGQLAGTVALRRLSGGAREAIAQSAAEAKEIVPMLNGTSFARSQSIGMVDGVPYLTHEYAGGRSLRHIVDRARGGTNQMPNPIPIDQAIVVAEKVALSLATTGDLKYGEKRLLHGALLPQFIWISDDGEIRVAGQQLGRGIIASLRDARVAGEISRYIAPEIRATGEPTKASEVFSMGAILYLLVTGEEPPEALTTSAFASVVRAAKTMSGHDMPAEIRTILDKSLAIDPAARYASMTEMKQALSALAHGGKYSATTFNLAFYLSNLLKKEMESEAIDREKESKVNAAAYAEQPAMAHATAPAAIATPMFGVPAEEPKKRNMMPIYAAAAVVLVGGGIVAAMMMRGGAKPAPAPPPPVKAQVATPAPVVVAQPVVAATSTTATVDPEAQKKAFEQAVAQRLQEEMLKLQKDYTQQLKQQQSKNAPVPVPPPASPQQRPQVAEERSAPSAAALDERRLEQKQAQTPQPAASRETPQQVAQLVPQQQQQQAAPPPSPAVREGDVVEFDQLDAPVNPVSRISPIYPPMARRAQAQATVLLSTLIDEDGRVVDVKVLRGDPRYGFNDEAIRAVRATRFSPPRKDGKRVKTWRPQPIAFTF
jgi:TonB family protein